MSARVDGGSVKMRHMTWFACSAIALHLAVTVPAAAQAFDCVIDPAVVVRVGTSVPGPLQSVQIQRGKEAIAEFEVVRDWGRAPDKLRRGKGDRRHLGRSDLDTIIPAMVRPHPLPASEERA